MFEELSDGRRGGRPRHRGPESKRDPRMGHARGQGGFDRGDWGGRGMRSGGPFGFGDGFGRGPRVRRGDVRTAILVVLADQPMHGYQVMQELRERSGGVWAPSAGSIYPTLQQLEDEGLVRSQENDGRRVFTLTDEGRAQAVKAAETSAPWETDRGRDAADLRAIAMQVTQAAMQVYQVGSANATADAQRILANARRDLYQLLATDGQAEVDPAASPAPDQDGDAGD